METFLVVIGVIALLVVGGYRYEKRNAAANTGAHNIVCPHCKTSGNVHSPRLQEARHQRRQGHWRSDDRRRVHVPHRTVAP